MKKLIWLLLLTGCASSPKFSADHTLFAEFTPAEIAAFPAPPAKGSPAEEKDLAALEKIQSTRTAADCAAAMAQKRPLPELLFATYPFAHSAEASQILWRVRSDAVNEVRKLKERFARPRPFRGYPARIRPCYDELHGASYPSGHAAIAQVTARALAAVDPSRAVAYQKEADLAARYRLVAGVHYATDVQAGLALGNALFAKMRKNPAFRQELERLRVILKNGDESH